jgi:hypothetical protein
MIEQKSLQVEEKASAKAMRQESLGEILVAHTRVRKSGRRWGEGHR